MKAKRKGRPGNKKAFLTERVEECMQLKGYSEKKELAYECENPKLDYPISQSTFYQAMGSGMISPDALETIAKVLWVHPDYLKGNVGKVRATTVIQKDDDGIITKIEKRGDLIIPPYDYYQYQNIDQLKLMRDILLICGYPEESKTLSDFELHGLLTEIGRATEKYMDWLEEKKSLISSGQMIEE